MTGDLVGVIEAAYRIEQDEATWMGGLLDQIEPCMGRGMATFCVRFDTSAEQLEMDLVAERRFPTQAAELMIAAFRALPPSLITKMFGAAVCSTVSDVLGIDAVQTPAVDAFRRGFGIGDGIGIIARDPTPRGLAIGVALPEPERLPEAIKDTWSQIAAHVAAAHRLRQQLATEPHTDGASGSVEAILDERGELADALDPAKTPEARAALRGAAVAIDRARGKLRREAPAEAVHAWSSMVDARWTLVDRFERDGRRFFLARRNEAARGEQPEESAPALTLRELQVVGFAALGHSNKLIAYELGLSISTVATHLSRAQAKLGCASRAELIRRFAA